MLESRARVLSRVVEKRGQIRRDQQEWSAGKQGARQAAPLL